MSDKPVVSIAPLAKVKSYPFDKVASFRNISIFATAVAILFQGSYMYALSPILLSYMSLQDTIFKTALALPVIGFFLGTIINFIEDFESRLDAGKGFKGSDAHKTSKGFLSITVMLGFLIFCYCSYNVLKLGESVSEQLVWLKLAGSLVLLPVVTYLLAQYLWQLAVVRHDAESQGIIASRSITNLVYFGFLGAIIFGLLGGLANRGTTCEVFVGEEAHEARFLVNVGDITAFEMSDQVVLFNSSKIDQITCDR